MTVGCISRLRAGYQSGRFRVKDVWRLFASRIAADHEAHANQSHISALGLTPTNAILSSVDEAIIHPHIDRIEQHLGHGQDLFLRGIPILVKDNFCTDWAKWGLSTTCASRALESFRAPYDACVVDALSRAGAYVLGKTNLDEFAMGCGSTDSALAGPVVNPWSFRQTKSAQSVVIAGGSSGGSAAAVAAGLSPVALASDTGGSARIPAAYCGVVGLKPTYGLVSRHGLIPLTNALDVPAVIGASVADVAAILVTWLDPVNPQTNLLDGTCVPLNPNQLIQVRAKLLQLSSESPATNSSSLRIGIPVEYHVPGLDQDVAMVWDQVAGWLADELTCPVQLVRMPHTPMATSVYSVLCAVEVASNMARYDGLRYGHSACIEPDHAIPNSTEAQFAHTRSQGFNAVVRGRILAGNYFLLRSQAGRHLESARRLWRLIKQDFDEVFNHVDVLLTPVAPGPATPLDQFLRFDNRTRTTLDDVCTVGANLAGVPAVTIPITLSTQTGLPIGLQLIGRAWSEPELLQLAAWVEQRSGFAPLVDWADLLSSLGSTSSQKVV